MKRTNMESDNNDKKYHIVSLKKEKSKKYLASNLKSEKILPVAS